MQARLHCTHYPIEGRWLFAYKHQNTRCLSSGKQQPGKPFAWAGRHQLPAAPPQAACLPLKSGVRLSANTCDDPRRQPWPESKPTRWWISLAMKCGASLWTESTESCQAHSLTAMNSFVHSCEPSIVDVVSGTQCRINLFSRGDLRYKPKVVWLFWIAPNVNP